MQKPQDNRDPRHSRFGLFLGDDCRTFRPDQFGSVVTEEINIGDWVVEIALVPGGHYVRVVHARERRVVMAELMATITPNSVGLQPTVYHEFNPRLVFSARRRIPEMWVYDQEGAEVSVATDMALNLVTPNRGRYMPAFPEDGTRLARELPFLGKPRSVVVMGYGADAYTIRWEAFHEFVLPTGHVMPLTCVTHVRLGGGSFQGSPREYPGPRLVYSRPD